MIEIAIPGFTTLKLAHLVLDFNGTLAVDGRLLDGVKSRLNALSEKLKTHVLTADTFGRAKAQLADVPCSLTILPPANQPEGKLAFVQQLGVERVAAVGNGRNDRLMIKAAALGIVVLQEEGTAVETLLAANVAAPDIFTALDLLTNPLRLAATLRL